MWFWTRFPYTKTKDGGEMWKCQSVHVCNAGVVCVQNTLGLITAHYKELFDRGIQILACLPVNNINASRALTPTLWYRPSRISDCQQLISLPIDVSPQFRLPSAAGRSQSASRAELGNPWHRNSPIQFRKKQKRLKTVFHPKRSESHTLSFPTISSFKLVFSGWFNGVQAVFL